MFLGLNTMGSRLFLRVAVADLCLLPACRAVFTPRLQSSFIIYMMIVSELVVNGSVGRGSRDKEPSNVLDRYEPPPDPEPLLPGISARLLLTPQP